MRSTGSIAPSSRFLARNIKHLLNHHLDLRNSGPVKILEIGPGSGVLTKQIIRSIRPEDEFDIVEINEQFFELIDHRYRHLPNVHTHHLDFLEFDNPYHYDYIFSSIPYESLPSHISKMMWEKKLKCCKNGSFITYYKYVNFNHFRCKYEKDLVSQYCLNEKLIIRNLPPAKLFTLKINNHPLIKSVEKREPVLVEGV